MSGRHSFWAVVPFKGTAQAKQRLASALTAPQRHALALAMLGTCCRRSRPSTSLAACWW